MGPSERALLFLGAAAQGMAAAVPGEGALSEEHVGMAGPENVAPASSDY